MSIFISVWSLLLIIVVVVGAFILNWVIGLVFLFLLLPLLAFVIYDLKELL